MTCLNIPAFRKRAAVCLPALVLCLFFAGCGQIIDKDRIKVAEIQDDAFTRGDFARVLRNMSNEERPIIANRGDLLRALRQHMDTMMKQRLAAQLVSEDKINVPWELAEQIYLQRHPEHAGLDEVTDPAAIGTTADQLEFMKDERDAGIDKLYQELLGEAAVSYRIGEALEAGLLTITEEEYEREYRYRGDELKKLEQIEFDALVFPTTEAGREAMAQAKDRLDNGVPFETLFAERAAQTDGMVMQSAIENNPASTRFRSFWMTAAGAQEGDILGPVFLPAAEAVGPDGRPTGQVTPACYLLLKVVSHSPERPKTLEEAKADLAPDLWRAKMVALLREEYGIKLYEENLPDPAADDTF